MKTSSHDFAEHLGLGASLDMYPQTFPSESNCELQRAALAVASVPEVA